MKAIIDLIGSVISGTTKIDKFKLPTQGYFYTEDFDIRIKKGTIEDIIEYEYNYVPDNVLEIIENIKNFVRKNIFFSKGYVFEDLKSVDIIFIFLEIVKFTNKKPIKVNYFDSQKRQLVNIDFNPKQFNYFDFSLFKKYHLPEICAFEIDGYKFSMPSIGIENCVTEYLLNKVNDKNSEFYNEQRYDFLFFIGNKNYLSEEEIENLIIIFNQDLDEEERENIKSIIKKFQNLIGYSVRVDNRIIDLKSNLDLANIWKD
jgi:hypothetical protein